LINIHYRSLDRSTVKKLQSCRTNRLAGIARKRGKWWAVLFLPILLRALVPVGFMPMVGPGFSVQLVLCEGYAPVPWTTALPAEMPMDMPMGSDSHSGAPVHDDHGSCPYGSAPAFGALPTLASLPALLIQRSPERPAAVAQVAYVEVSPRAQSPRGPPA
jgi:hypothetical protein